MIYFAGTVNCEISRSRVETSNGMDRDFHQLAVWQSPVWPADAQANKLVSFPAFEHFHVSGVLCPVSRVTCLVSTVLSSLLQRPRPIRVMCRAQEHMLRCYTSIINSIQLRAHVSL